MAADQPQGDRAGGAGWTAALFLDRDGVINVDRGYVHRPEDLAFTPTAIEAIRIANAADYRVIVVTNQSGVARGMFSADDVERFHDHMRRQLDLGGGHVDAFYYCPFHPAGVVPEYAMEHEDRKPAPGMIRRAIAEWNIDPDRSFLIGDRPRDVEAAQAAGVRGFLVPTDVGDLASEVRTILAGLPDPCGIGMAR